MKKKILGLALCALLLVGGSVFGTYAYLTSQATVKNTFTVGDVEITLDETDVTEYGVATGNPRDTENEYRLVPGHYYVKDPIIHVAANSEDCYLFVKVENALTGIEAETTIANQMAAKGWVELGNGVYYYQDKVLKNAEVVNVPVFDGFTLRGDIADLTAYEDSTIVVTAYAVQADGFANQTAAWNAAFGSN